ncbi:TetR/AcrR family transcriptional regulator [Macrococcoides canis]|uniref:TetR/AcrR family transcriptional regulator n=1 Tax=Macrococcoides canis TaxID=1855823 RepID=UPI001B8C7383|nr:TetR/AcrR family transcriptional regulator [Macrococcus canis]
MNLTGKQLKIIESATSLFESKGYSATGIDEIVKNADVATMTLYRNFKSKDDLVLAVLKYREYNYLKCIKEASDIYSMLSNHFEWIEHNTKSGCLFLRAAEEYRNINDQILKFVENHKDKVLGQIMKYVETEKIAVEIMMILEGSTSMVEYLPVEKVKVTSIYLMNKVIEDVS